MFDTERFIVAVRERICIWDLRVRCYHDKTAKKRAWDEIGKMLYKDWEYDTENKLEDLRKKWKHLRDYYVKEKKLNFTKSGSGTLKKRKAPYMKMLRFLDGIKQTRTTPIIVNSPDDNNSLLPDATDSISPEITQSSNTEPSHRTRRAQAIHLNEEHQFDSTPKLRRAHRHHQESPNDENQQPVGEDSDTRFLLSLLPQIRSMDERQNFEFKMEVMQLIHKIKYQSSDVHKMQPHANNYAHEQPSFTAVPSSSVHSMKSSESIESLESVYSVKEEIDEIFEYKIHNCT